MDWTTATFINMLFRNGFKDIASLDAVDARKALVEAQAVAAKSVGYMSSKGMIHEALE